MQKRNIIRSKSIISKPEKSSILTQLQLPVEDTSISNKRKSLKSQENNYGGVSLKMKMKGRNLHTSLMSNRERSTGNELLPPSGRFFGTRFQSNLQHEMKKLEHTTGFLTSHNFSMGQAEMKSESKKSSQVKFKELKNTVFKFDWND